MTTSAQATSYYSGAFGVLYRRLVWATMPRLYVSQEAEHVAELLGLQAGERVLDAGCGFGRYAREFAKRGYRTVGVDLSVDMLSDGTAARSAGARLLAGDVRRLPFQDASFEAAANLCSTLGLGADEDDAQALQELARVLTPRGRVLVDVANGQGSWMHRSRPRSQVLGAALWMQQDASYDPQTKRVDKVLTLEPFEGEPLSCASSLRIYSPEELTALAEAAGLRRIGLYGTRDGLAYEPEQSPRIVLLAEKPQRLKI